MADYYAILTNTGKALEAAAIANGTKITLIKFVVGDGNGQAQIPDPARTTLVHEVYRNSISDLTVSTDQPNQIIAQLVMPANVGGFTVREIGLLTDKGELYAIANCATFDKPVNGVSITMQFRLAVSDTDNITLNVATGEGLFLRQDANLSDVKDKTKARQNLQLGSAATKNVGIAEGNVMQVGAFGLGAGPQAKDNAYSNVAQFYRVNASSTNAPPITGNIAAGVVSLPCDAAPSTGYVAVSGNGAAYVGASSAPANGVKWSRIYTTDYKPTAADIGAVSKTGDTIDWLTVRDGLSTGNDLTVGRTFFVKGMEFIVKQGLQDPVNNYRQTNGMRIQGAGNLFVDIYQAERMGEYHFLGIHVANGGADGWYEFRNNGSFYAGGIVGAGGGNGSKLHPDGNIEGSMWDGYLNNWLNSNISNAQNNAQNWAYQNLVNAVRLSGRTVLPDTGGRIDLPSGCVYTGMSGANYGPGTWGAYSAIQVLINGQWATVGTV
ncbi:phage tail protein [Serratia plymuthica]|uniref:phage tail protein n=1 Tax=Serratia plymuthica TaxID=82996 RepID=UPI0009368F54|nr:phage tail protein [Serratia plymuthica]OJT41523.1 hypothetical protein BSR04_11330 [Serratia plymuthica]